MHLLDMPEEVLRYVVEQHFVNLFSLTRLAFCCKKFAAFVKSICEPAKTKHHYQRVRIKYFRELARETAALGDMRLHVEWKQYGTPKHKLDSIKMLCAIEDLAWIFARDESKYKYARVKNPEFLKLREYVERQRTDELRVRNAVALCHAPQRPCACFKPGHLKWGQLLNEGLIESRTTRGKKEYVWTATEHCLRCIDSSIDIRYMRRVRPDQEEGDDLLLIRPDGYIEDPGSAPALSSCLMHRRYIKTLGRGPYFPNYGVVVVTRCNPP